MRTRTIVAALTLGLATSAAAGGCQIIAGLNMLQGEGTGGGPTGTSTSTSTRSSSSSSSSSSSGAACSPPCAGGDLCYPGPMGSPSMCQPCGTALTGVCAESDGGCASCDGMTCLRTCSTAAPCTGTVIVHAETSAAKLVCDSTCLGSTIQCQGLFPCEVECSMGVNMDPTCDGTTTIVCDEGPCTVVCDMKGCMGPTMNCGSNACLAAYTAPSNVMPPIMPNCGNACSCTTSDAGAPQ